MAFLPLVEMPLLSISKNYFYQNGANGITVSADSRPEVWENVFQNKGFAINVAQNASTILLL